MNSWRNFPIGLLLLTATAGLVSCGSRDQVDGRAEPADAVVYGRIITMDPANPRAKGLAIRDGLIVAVDSPEALRKYVNSSTKIFNWSSRTIVPGLIDAHVDLLALGESLVGFGLKDAGGMDDIAGRVRAVLAERGLGEQRWVIGHGWEENQFRDNDPIDRARLDDIAPNRPVLLYRADRSAAIANGEALRLADLDSRAQDPPGGRFVRRADGSLTGLLLGRAVEMVSRLVPPHAPEVREAMLQAALSRLSEAGYTTVHDMGGDAETWRVLHAMGEAGELPIRVYTSVPSTDPELEEFLTDAPKLELFQHMLTLRTIRIELDGNLGSRTSLLLAPYTDAPRESGLTVASEQELRELAQRCYKAGFQLAISGSGDGAVRLTLNTLEQLMPTWSHWQNIRPRLEGIDLIDPEDPSRFGMTHLIASLQPARCSRQMHWLQDRLGEARLEWVHPWRSLERGGAVIILGSGAPELDVDPRKTLVSTISRVDETGWPAGGWKPAQRLTAAEALAAMTSNAAYAAFQEQLKGSIRPGKLADLTVLNRDLLYLDPEDLDKLRVLGTMISGKIRYRTRHLR